jgi:hypothetical protein
LRLQGQDCQNEGEECQNRSSHTAQIYGFFLTFAEV